MKRTSPFFTLPGIALTIVFLVSLAVFSWFKGGQAFSPGRLSAQGQTGAPRRGFTSHRDFEKQCKLCHAPLQSDQSPLCLDCHTEVAGQIQNLQGTHGLLETSSPCFRCHTEHKGQDYNILQPGLALYDHEKTGFSLIWHQLDYAAAPLSCSACHTLDNGFTLDQGRCADCHAAEDASFMLNHSRDFGADCLACHDGRDQMVDFQHSQTAFPLEAKHAAAACADCHPMKNPAAAGLDRFSAADTACASCHDNGHPGLFSQACEECHNPSAWSPADWQGSPFAHQTSGFSLARHALTAQGSPLTCTDCHRRPLNQSMLPACRECHGQGSQGAAFIAEHDAQFGPACLDCHDGVDRMSSFDHNRFFPLAGRHADLDCLECHADRVFVGTPTRCVDCHPEPQIHQGVFGLECQDCHTSQAWSPARLRSHTFPLDHGESGLVACQTCHPTSYVEYTCYGCHEHEPFETAAKHQEEGVSAADLPDCSECHPTGQKEESGDD